MEGREGLSGSPRSMVAEQEAREGGSGDLGVRRPGSHARSVTLSSATLDETLPSEALSGQGGRAAEGIR